MRSLVTGSSGFIGGALTRRLLADGHEVRVLLRSGREGNVGSERSVDVRVGGLDDPNPIAEAAAGCDVVFHCAGAGASHASQRALAWINVAGTENVLRATQHAGVPRFVHLSCADVTLLDADRLGWKEDTVLTQAPLGSCLQSKLLADELVRQASTARFDTATVRPAWLWGPGDRVNLPGLLAEARTGGVRLFGRGENIFATAYVDNVVAALVAAGSATHVGGKAYHVADGEFLNAREFFGLLCEALGLGAPRKGLYALDYARAWLREQQGQDGPWTCDVARRGRACLLDCGRAAQELGYTPHVTVTEGMQALARWVREVGGPDAVRKLARAPQSDADAEAHARVADAHDLDA